MKVTWRDQEWEFAERMQVREMLARIDLVPQTVLVVRDGKLLTQDAMLEPEDKVRLLPVVAGG